MAKYYKFVIQYPFANASDVVTVEEFDDNVNESELDATLEALIFEQIDSYYVECDENGNEI